MELLQQTSTKLVNGLREMTATARTALAIVALLFVAGAVLLIRGRDARTDHYLLGGRAFQPAELARIETAFSTAGLNDYVIREKRICIPLKHRNEYLAALDRGHALPAEIGDVFDEVARNDSWFESSEQRQLKVLAGLERQASQLFSEMEGIERAVVKFGEMNQGAFARRSKRSATVALRLAAGAELELPQVRAIQNSLTGFGVAAENVAVFDLEGGVTYLGQEHAQPFETGSRIYTAAQSLHEKRLTARIRTMLSQYPGVQVGVHVQLRSDGASQTAIVATDRGVSQRDTPGELDGEPTGSVLTHARLRQVSRAASAMAEGAKQSQTTGMRWVPDRVTASISLPRSYFHWRWRHEQINGRSPEAANRSPTVGELRRVLEATSAEISPRVANLLPPCENPADRIAQVDVGMHPDPETAAAPAPAGAVWHSVSWVPLAGWVGVGALGCLLWGAARQWGASRDAAFATTVDPTADEKSPVIQPESYSNQAAEVGGTGQVFRELEARIDSDRDAAVRVLRNWVESAA
ncbi:MAG: hypothetical protein CMJ75_17405 [Planctomycetaceae bacterium]|nr:hypothetical protein [Planctomycetaceae bacterium]